MRYGLLILILATSAHADTAYIRDFNFNLNHGFEYDLYLQADAKGGQKSMILRPPGPYAREQETQVLIAPKDTTSPRASLRDGKVCLRRNLRSACLAAGQDLEINFGGGTLGFLRSKEDAVLIMDPNKEIIHGISFEGATARAPASAPQK